MIQSLNVSTVQEVKAALLPPFTSPTAALAMPGFAAGRVCDP